MSCVGRDKNGHDGHDGHDGFEESIKFGLACLMLLGLLFSFLPDGVSHGRHALVTWRARCAESGGELLKRKKKKPSLKDSRMPGFLHRTSIYTDL